MAPLGGRDARCVVARCEANKCVAASFPKGPLKDDVAGDCGRLACDGNGYLRYEIDRTDTGESVPCREISCDPDPVSRLAIDGTPCWSAATDDEGICRKGECVPVDRDAGDDASLNGSDGASDASTDVP